MDAGIRSETVARRDAGNEPPGMDLRRVSERMTASIMRG